MDIANNYLCPFWQQYVDRLARVTRSSFPYDDEVLRSCRQNPSWVLARYLLEASATVSDWGSHSLAFSNPSVALGLSRKLIYEILASVIAMLPYSCAGQEKGLKVWSVVIDCYYIWQMLLVPLKRKCFFLFFCFVFPSFLGGTYWVFKEPYLASLWSQFTSLASSWGVYIMGIIYPEPYTRG